LNVNSKKVPSAVVSQVCSWEIQGQRRYFIF
jgi:hypothetical protein